MGREGQGQGQVQAQEQVQGQGLGQSQGRGHGADFGVFPLLPFGRRRGSEGAGGIDASGVEKDAPSGGSAVGPVGGAAGAGV